MLLSSVSSSVAGGTGGGGAGPVTMPKIHDDFETAALSSIWTVTDPYGNPAAAGTAVIDTTKSKTGKSSLKVNDGFVGTTPPGPAFYGRVWLWMEKDPGTGHWADFIGLGPNVKGTGVPTEVRYGGQFGILQANYFGDDSLALANNNYFNDNITAGYTPPTATWSCFEFYYGKDEIRLWLNGSEFALEAGNPPYPGLHVTTKWPTGSAVAPWSPAYDTIRIGFHNYGGAAVLVWYDDVAFDVNRIGCTN